MTSCHCQAVDQEFNTRIARRDLRRFLRRGPEPSTKAMLAALLAVPLPPNPTLLDVGGGIGALHHTLLDRGFARALQVDISEAYLATAAAEAARRGHTGRVAFRQGDFSSLAPTLPAADVVTLDRVVCCDPDFARLLAAAADRARSMVAFSYPQSRWLVRAFVATVNVARRLMGRAFRAYVHPPAAMAAVLEQSGFRRGWMGGTWVWAVELFERAENATASPGRTP
jgi:2-polyprenyl-3-methyl-5-hydroxy-6-metoxy-1,4-benzoquinol methylase